MVVGAGVSKNATQAGLRVSPTPTALPSTTASTSPVPSPSLFVGPSPSGCLPLPSCPETTAIGNFEGTGQKQNFVAAPVNDKGGATVDWLLEIRGPTGTSHSASLSSLVAARGGCPALGDIQYARVLGAADFGGPSPDLALVEVGRGASTQSAVLVGVEGDGLRVVTVVSGAERCQRVFPFNGSVTHGNGLACGWRDNTPVLWVREVSSRPPTDYAHYDWYEATYAWQGLNLTLLSLDHAIITSKDQRFQPAYGVTCGGINLP